MIKLTQVQRKLNADYGEFAETHINIFNAYLQSFDPSSQANYSEPFLDQLFGNGGPYPRAGTGYSRNTSSPSLHC